MRNIAIALIVVAALGGFAWKKFHNTTPAAGGPAASAGAAAPSKDGKPAAGGAPGGAPMGMPVEAEVIAAQNIAQEIIAVGSLRSNEAVTLAPEIAGRLAKIRFTEGQTVSEGDVLFELDDSVARAELEQAKASLSLSERNAERAEELFGRKLISTRERDEAGSKLALDQASVKLAEARLAKTRIRAPFTGTVGLRAVSPGDYVSPGQALAPLEQINVLKADFRLSEAALPAVAVGQTLNLEVDAYPGQTFTGKVYAIDPRLAEETRSIGLRARVPNDNRKLRPGLFARVRLAIRQHANAVMVPEQSIVPQGEALFVYVIEDGKAAMKPVKIGMRQNGRAEIVEGVSPGDTVITAGVQKIGPGSPVMAVNLMPPPGGAPAGAPADGKPADKAAEPKKG